MFGAFASGDPPIRIVFSASFALLIPVFILFLVRMAFF